jgi:xanthosine phosphorylase
MFCCKKPDLNRDIRKSADVIRGLIHNLNPKIAVVLGSGLGGLADRVHGAVEIPYSLLPGFPRPSVQGHEGKLVAGTIEGVPVVFLKGRVHLYEGVGPAPIKVMIRTLKTLGIDTLFLSNAAGSLRTEAPAGGLIAIADQINLTGLNPLVGPNDEDWGPRFPPMDNAWDADLRALLTGAAKKLNIPMIEGVYAGFMGPTFETHAEVRMAKILGADSVGMSTVAECIMARHCGLKVVGCSAITNMAAGMGTDELSHDQTIEWAAVAGEKLSHVVVQFLQDWHAAR